MYTFHSWHSSDPADFNNILWGSAIAAPTNPLKQVNLTR